MRERSDGSERMATYKFLPVRAESVFAREPYFLSHASDELNIHVTVGYAGSCDVQQAETRSSN